MPTSKMPDLTPAQLVALLATLITALSGAALLDSPAAKLVVVAGVFLVLVAWIIADAIIRHGRSRALIPPPTSPTGPSA